MASLNDNLNYLGIAIIAAFALAWIASATIFKFVGRRPTAVGRLPADGAVAAQLSSEVQT